MGFVCRFRGATGAVLLVLAALLGGDSHALMRQRGSSAPSDAPATPFGRAEKAAAAGDCAAALPLLEEALAAEPEDADALALRGYCLRKSGQLDEAFASYREALAIRPEFPAARQYLGEAHLQAALRELEILRGYGDDGRTEVEALVGALREAADAQARRKPSADEPPVRW